jgi:hypothetical protein
MSLLSGSQMPRIREMAGQNMAVVYTNGDYRHALLNVVAALYGRLDDVREQRQQAGKPGIKTPFLRARFLDTYLHSLSDAGTVAWGLPIPDDVMVIPPGPIDVEIDPWEYGLVAETLHVGDEADEDPTIQMLRKFIATSGYEIAGPLEKEYLILPLIKDGSRTIIGTKINKKTIIRCHIHPRMTIVTEG